MPCECELTTRHDSVRTLLESNAELDGAALYLVSARDARQLSYEEFRKRVVAWRHVLHTYDIRAGARVGLLIADPLDFAAAFFAVLCDGSWVVPLNPKLDESSIDQLDDRLSTLHLDGVISERVVATHSKVPWIIVRDEDVDDDRGAVAAAPPVHGGIILSSSGTTGTPKVIALTEHQLLFAARLIAEHNRLSPDERGFNPLPLWHINAEVVGLLATLVAGASLVLDDRFHRSDFWSLVDRFEVTWINAVPAIISRIAVLNEREVVPERLRFVRSASAPLSPELLANFESTTGVAVIESYGMTEAASQICVNPLEGPRKIGSVGPPVGVELRVTPLEDSHDATADIDTADVGHVEIRGPSVVTHYEAGGYEDRFDAEGWLKTGDLGFLDEDGYLFLVGRSDDVINRGGEKIFPREIEDVVLALPDVAAAAVLGVPDDVFGQVPVLYVQFDLVREPQRNLAEHVEVLETVLNARFARARRPVRVVVVESFPAHATGKIQKKSLAADAGTILFEREIK
jgi:acyl-CoA synthetase (AMP-forming)/AMP-acid ligase II